MARLGPILSALAKAELRDVRSLGSVVGNNFFFITLILIQSGGFIPLMFGLLLLFPMSADPLKKVPPDRLALWPLTATQKATLRAASLWLSPTVWLVAVLVLWLAAPLLGIQLLLAVVAVHAVAGGLSRIPGWKAFRLLRSVPAPPGRLGELVRKDLRQMLSVLDTYLALILSIAGGIYRFAASDPEPKAAMVLSVIVVLALSSYAQCLFGLDGESEMTRYRLLPLRGWQILASKGVAFLGVVLILTAPLAPLSGLAGACAALAIGHSTSVRKPAPQVRWRFCSGSSLVVGLMQAGALFFAGGATCLVSPWVALASAGGYASSLFWFGRKLWGGTAVPRLTPRSASPSN